MRICIYGAGAVGSNFAARLDKAGAEVSIVARGPHLEAIQARGITVHSGDETLTAAVTATENPAELGPQDLVIITAKAPSLPGIVDGIKPLLGADTPVVFGMNGIGWWYFFGLDPAGEERQLEALDPGQRWWNEIGPERAIGGVVYSANEVTEPGVIHNGSPTRNQLRIGEPSNEASSRVSEINALLDRADMAIPVSDIRRDLWEKLLGNIAYGPISSLTGSTIGQITANPELAALAEAIMGEATDVARALGTELSMTPAERIRATKSSNHKPSMFQDLERGRAMEIDAIVAVPQALGQAAGIATPNLDRVLALLKQRAVLAGSY